MHQREQPQEVIFRQARDLRDLIEIDRPGVVRLHEIGGVADAAEHLAPGRGARQLQRLHSLLHLRAMPLHALEQEVQLLFVPALVVEPLQRVRSNEAEHRRDTAIVRLQILDELRLGHRYGWAVGERAFERNRHGAASSLRQSRTEADDQRLHRMRRAEAARIAAAVIEDQEVVVVDADLAAADPAELSAAPGRAYGQRVDARAKLGTARPAQHDAVLAAPAGIAGKLRLGARRSMV